MDKVIKKESFEKKLSLEERLQTLAEDVDSPVASPATKILSKGDHRVQEEGQKIIAEARRRALLVHEEAKRLLDAVQEKVEEERKAGYEMGYQEGLAEVTERLTAVSKLEDAFLKDVEPKMIRLAYDIAEKVLNRELREERAAIVERVKGALRELSGSHLVIRVNAEDLETVKAHQSELGSVVDALSTIIMKEDASVAKGDCVIESEIGVIEARLDSQLAAIKKALGI